MPQARTAVRAAGPWAALGVALVVVLLALAGCASAPPPQAEAARIDVPMAWSASEGDASLPTSANAPSLARWWARFSDPQLTALEAQALQANTTVTGAQAALRQARALRDVAAAALRPSLGVSASAQHSSSGVGAGRSTANNFQAGLDASWELDIFGAHRDALNASEASARASAASLGDVQVSIASELALAYITLRAGQARLLIAQENLANQQDTLQITQWRQQAGLVTALEADQARASAEQTRALLPALQTGIAQTRHALAVLTGQPPANLAASLAPVMPVPQASDDLVLAIPAETLRQRPDVRAAELQVTAALARVAQADAARAPSFRLSGTLGWSALTLGALTDGASVVSSLLAGVSLPLFDGGAASAQLRAQQAAADQARVVYLATVLAALREVEDALVALRGDRLRLTSLHNAADAATRAAGLARQRYSSGLVDFQTVLETQRTQLSTQDSVASASADVSSDHVRLYKALGGGWQAEADASTSRAAHTSNPP